MALCPSKQFFSHVGTEPPLPGYYQYFSRSKCVFAQGHNTALVGIEPRPPALELWALPLGHRAPPAGNEDMHKRLDEFVFRPVLTTDYRVICP